MTSMGWRGCCSNQAAFEAADDLHEVLGREFCDVYGEVKREEMRLFHREISPWEREHLLLNV